MDQQEKEIFDGMSKEEIWRKWQSDKKQLSLCFKILASVGINTEEDLKNPPIKTRLEKLVKAVNENYYINLEVQLSESFLKKINGKSISDKKPD